MKPFSLKTNKENNRLVTRIVISLQGPNEGFRHQLVRSSPRQTENRTGYPCQLGNSQKSKCCFIFCNVLTVLYYNIVDMEPVTYFLFLLHYFIGYHFPRVPTWILARSGFEDEGVHIHPRRLDMSPGGGSQRNVYHSRWSCGNNQVSRTHNDMTTESLKDFWNRDNQHLVSMLQITFLYFIRKGNYRGHFQGYLILHNNKWSRWR